MKTLSYEYIRGLIDSEGCFTFCTTPPKKNTPSIRSRIPAFVLSMSKRDEDLIRSVKESLELNCTIHIYNRKMRNDGYKRSAMVTIMIRDFGQLKNTIVPLCYKKLNGYKYTQFIEWVEIIKTDPAVPKLFKLIPALYESGFYDRHNKFS